MFNVTLAGLNGEAERARDGALCVLEWLQSIVEQQSKYKNEEQGEAASRLLCS